MSSGPPPGAAAPAACPVCGAAGGIAPWLEKHGHRVWRCAGCTAAFVHPVPPADALAAIYGAGYYRRGAKYREGEETRPDAATRNERRRAALVKHYAGSGDLLDVGCATGGFLVEARRAGFRVRGVELSASAAREARERHGLEVEVSDAGRTAGADGSCRTVTLWDVIEHVADPHAALRNAWRLLAPGGHLFLTTGDAGAPWARFTGRYWPLLTPPQHLFFHTRASLATLLGRAGFALEAVLHEGKYANLGLLALKLRESLGGGFSPVSAFVEALGLERAAVWVNLGDVMTAVAVKRPLRGS